MARRPREEVRVQPIDLKPDIAVGVTLPFSGKRGGLFTLSYTTEDQGVSNLKNLLLTRKGERRNQPNFGSAIYDTLFENITADSPDLLRRSILADISFWLPYIIVDDLSVNVDEASEIGLMGHGLRIRIFFRVTENGANQAITLSVTPNGQASID